jgi:hypothetical protein
VRRDEQGTGGLAPGSALVAAPAPTYGLQSTAYSLRSARPVQSGHSVLPRRRLRSEPFGCGHPAALWASPGSGFIGTFPRFARNSSTDSMASAGRAARLLVDSGVVIDALVAQGSVGVRQICG